MDKEDFAHTNVLFVQEHELVSDSEIRDAVNYASARGWHASVNPAILLETGKPSCGVGILVRAGRILVSQRWTPSLRSQVIGC